MKKLFAGFDWVLFVPALILALIGLVIIWSLAPNLFFHQLLYLFLGLIFFFIFSLIDFRIFERLSPLIFVGCLAFLLTPLIFGQLTRGALRWIKIGSFSLQPSELVKPFLVIFFAYFFAQKEKISPKAIITAGLLLILPVFLVFIQPDLGSSLVVTFSWLGILLATDIYLKTMAFILIPAVAILPVFWRFLKTYQQERITTFLNPLKDPLGAGYNVLQATIAAGAGQFFGRGLGRGTQSHLRFLPEHYTDFIFASLAEELGFFGAIITLILFGIILWRILKISKQTPHFFGTLICTGVFAGLFCQIFINIGMNLGILPITGIPLPLISSGGSSFLTTMISLGIIENISRLKKRGDSSIILANV